jgi:hypothetical protein
MFRQTRARGMADSATIVQAQGRRLAKLIRGDGSVEQYDSAKTVNLLTARVPDLDALAGLLHRLALRRDCCMVRGAIVDPARTKAVRRLCRPCPKTGDAPTLAEHARRWLALDLDSVPLDPSVDRLDLLACARAVTWRLPDPLRNARCIVQATASHGIKPGARLRLWYWLARPLTNPECKAWLKRAPADLSLFSPAQPHYTAAPIFIGMADPLPARLAMLPGHAAAVPPDRDVLLPPKPAQEAPARPLGGLRPGARGGGAGRFAALLATVRNAPDGKRHPTLFWAACRAGEMVASGDLDAERAAAALAQAAMDGGGAEHPRALRTAHDGIAQGRAGGAA